MKIKVDIEKEALPESVYFDILKPGDFFVGVDTFTIYVKIENTGRSNCYSFRTGLDQFFDAFSPAIPINMKIEVTL